MPIIIIKVKLTDIGPSGCKAYLRRKYPETKANPL